jgi:TonB-dependent receptor
MFSVVLPNRTLISVIASLAMILTSSQLTMAAEAGMITGVVVDRSTGDKIAGATIKVDGTKKGAYSDLKGHFVIKSLDAGVYTVSIRALGYNDLTVNSVEVAPGAEVKLDLMLQSQALEKEAVVVEAAAIRDNDAALLKERQKSVAVSDAISSESISRVAGSSVADVAQRVTGVSVMDGKYLYVRGLGDRYMNYQMNGAQMASSDPDRNDVAMDQYSTGFIESITTMKSFTPDQPGSFTGGSVNIKTKAFPSTQTLNASARFGYNTIASLNSNFTAASSATSDWFGMDNGTRALPSYVSGLSSVPDIGSTRNDADAAMTLHQASQAFSTPMTPGVGTSGLPVRFNMSYGDVFEMGTMPFGVTASMQYAQDFDSYQNGQFAQWQLTGNANEKDSLEAQSMLSDRAGTTSAFWGAMINMAIKPTPEHQLSFNVIHNQRGENLGRTLAGPLYRDLEPEWTFETQTQRYTERGNTTAQVLGEHLLSSLGGLELEWRGSYNSSYQDEPDIRFFSSNYKQDGDSTYYEIRPANYAAPAHYYRQMQEDLYWFDAAFKKPFTSWNGMAGNVKFGGAWNSKQRAFTESRYEFRNTNTSRRYNGDADWYFSEENVGIVDTNRGKPVYANYIVDVSQSVNNYNGAQTIAAGFAMIDLPVTSQLRVITGARVESTDLEVISRDTASPVGSVNEVNLLPSAAIIYALTDRQNVRLSYGRTLARPTFRELAPFSSFDFVGGFILNGNPNLKQTNVHNFDARWEWFMRPSDIIAVSGFYKHFTNPIENAIVSNNNQLQFQNVPEATVLGAEFEFRSSLDVLTPALSEFYVGSNLTLTWSQVNIPAKELEAIRALYGDDAPTTRPLQGQSPYLVNVQLGYLNYDLGTDANVTVNAFGDRLSRVALGGTPNVYEASRIRLDLVINQRLFGDLSMKVQALNLLNPVVREFHTFQGVEYDMIRYIQGQTFTIGFNYQF